jgi:hypothetical protein
MLIAVVPGPLHPWSGHQEAPGEVVTDALGHILAIMLREARVDLVNEWVVEDVFEFVSEAELLPCNWLSAIEDDMPAAMGPLCRT